jgi:hypothetical protein
MCSAVGFSGAYRDRVPAARSVEPGVADCLATAVGRVPRVLEEAAVERVREEGAGPGAAARVRAWPAALAAGKIAGALAAPAAPARDD